MKKVQLLLSAIILFSVYCAQAQEVKAPKFGKGIFDIKGEDDSWSMNLSARMQFLAISEWESEDGNLANPESNFLIRRARLKFKGFAFSPKLQYKIELGLSNRDIGGASEFTNNAPRYILDAVIKWNFYGNFTLWAGQTKLPGNVERVISSGDLSLVDRSLVNSRFNIDRDVGVQLRHHFKLSENFIVREKVSISQGEGRNVTTGNLGGHQYTGRIEMLPFGSFKGKGELKGSDLVREENFKLAVGATYDFNNNAVKTRSNLGSYMETDTGFYETNINTFFVDAMIKYRGFSFMGEYASRDAKDAVAKNADGTATGAIVQIGNGLNLQAGYLFNNNYEVTGRYTNIDLDRITGKGLEQQYTLGVSKFIVGHKLKIQTDISYLSKENSNNQLMYRLQFDVHF
ncbi:MAG: porin [Kordia sp.]|uniref:porin n=1 Tax=Kordia sp. TaxID=1965332 RepID=UPI00385838D9